MKATCIVSAIEQFKEKYYSEKAISKINIIRKASTI